MTLAVEITRSPHNRNLSARVVQPAADKNVRGPNLLEHRRIRRIPTAQIEVLARLRGVDPEIDIVWSILASPDLAPPYPKGTSRRQLHTELVS